MRLNKRLFVFFSMMLIAAGMAGMMRVRAFQGTGRTTAATKIVRSASTPAITQTIKSSAQNTTTRRGLFVISNVNGQTVCRIPTADEATNLFQRDPKTTLHVITPPEKASSAFSPSANGGLNIVLRGTDQLENFLPAKQAFIRAASHWEAAIQTPITIIIDVDFGPNDFGVPFPNGVIGATDTQSLEMDNSYDPNGQSGIRSALLADTSGPFDAQLHSALPVGSVPTDLGNVTAIDATSANLRALGILSPVADPATESNLGNPPNTGFNSAVQFDFDPTDGIDAGKTDFDAVATHEMGHSLGFQSDVGLAALIGQGATLTVTPWDLFRFRPGTTTGSFQSATRILSTGGLQRFFNGSADVAVSTGGPDGKLGDGQQASHWKDDHLTGLFIGIMDPTIAPGVRETITDDDLKMLDLIGYSLKVVVPTGCTFSLAPTSQSVGMSGGNGSFNVIAGTGCQWSAEAQDPWLSTTSTGTGNGVVSYSVAQNGDAFTRTGYISVGDQLFSVVQDPGTQVPPFQLPLTLEAGPSDEVCRLSPPVQFAASGGVLQYNITLDGGANDVDLYINFNRPVTDPGPSAQPFTADWVSNGPGGQESIKIGQFTTPPYQNGTYFITASNCKAFQVTATLTIRTSITPPCSFSVTPGTLSFQSSGGQSSATVTTACLWTASSSDTSWLNIASSVPVSGSGTVSYSVASNPSHVPRSAILTIAGQNFNVSQDVSQRSDQTITFDPLPNRKMGEPAFPLVATASSGLPVTFSLVSQPVPPTAVILNINGVLSLALANVGQVTVRASQVGDGNFNAATPVDRTFTISRGDLTIAFAPISNHTFGDTPFTLSAFASFPGLPVTFSVKQGPATISNGNLVTITGAGSVTIQADQAGNSNFFPAPPVTQSFTVAQQSQTITFAQPSDHTFGDSQFFLSASSTSGLGVTFSVLSGPAILSGNGVTLTGAGIVTIKADQAGNANVSPAQSVTRTFNVAKASQTITFGTLPNKSFGDPPFAVTATASSGLGVVFSVVSGNGTINGNTVTLTGQGPITIQADQAGDANFNPASPVQQSFTVTKGQAFINLTNLIQLFDGAPKSVTATTTPPGLSGLTVTYNGLPTPPSAIGSYSVVASLNNPDFQATNSLGTLSIIGFSPTDTQSANPGGQNTASVNPSGNNPGITANLSHTNGGVTATVTVGIYSGNPTERGLVNAGGGFVDVKVTSPNAGDIVVINYYYPSSVTAANETALQLYFFNGQTWQLVKGSGNTPPVKDTTDNLDGTVSGGKFTVTLDSTSNPKVSDLTGTVFAATTAVMGDVSGDNIVNVTDLVLMANILAGNFTPTAVQKDAADVQKDGTNHITVSDLITLANFLAGNTKTLPLGQ